MGPAQGALGVERQHRLRLEQAQFLEGLVVEGQRLAWHHDLQRHIPLRLGLGIDVTIGIAGGITGLQHVEIFSPDEGQLVVEAPLHQVHERPCREGCVVAVHDGDQIALGGGEPHAGSAQQPGQIGVLLRDGEGKRTHQQGFGIADAGENVTAGVEEGVPFLAIGRAHQQLQLAGQLFKQRFGFGPVAGREAGQDRLPLRGEQGLAAAHARGQGGPALGAQIVAGALEPMLNLLKILLLDR